MRRSATRKRNQAPEVYHWLRFSLLRLSSTGQGQFEGQRPEARMLNCLHDSELGNH